MINNYENILSIFERLADVSDKMVDENDPDAKGFIKCLYTLQYALKKLSTINLLMENKRLSKENTELNAKCENQKMEIKNLSENIFKLKFAGKDEILF